MVAVNSDTPHEEITILGMTFQAPRPYNIGYTLQTEGEASQLNQVLAENLRNNFSQKIYGLIEDYKKNNNIPEDQEVGVDVLDKEDLDTQFADYASKYEFGVRQARAGGARAPADPVGKEAHRIAMEKVKAAVTRKGLDWNSVPKEKRQAFVQQLLERDPSIRQEAERRINAVADIATDVLDLDLQNAA